MDVNEEIVRTWLQLCKNQFTMDDITFKVYRKKSGKGGGGHSNIDILAVDNKGIYYDYEVKWRSRQSIGATSRETPEALIAQMINKERDKKIKSITGRKSCKKIFITTHIFFRKRKEEMEIMFKDRGIKVLYFEDIIPELINTVNKKGRYDSPILQTIRMLKHFDLLKSMKS